MKFIHIVGILSSLCSSCAPIVVYRSNIKSTLTANADESNPVVGYTATSDSWFQTSLDPTHQLPPSAVVNGAWTGSEILLWGGYAQMGMAYDYNYTGVRYNPVSDTWRSMSSNMLYHASFGSSIWTGSKLFMWGGWDTNTGGNVDTGALYDPELDTWASVSTVGAPSARRGHSVTEIGNQQYLIYGGYDSAPTETGGIYNQQSDSWTLMSTPPSGTGAYFNSTSWVNNKLFVWGGADSTLTDTDSGVLYNPQIDTWTHVSPSPLSPREGHCSVTVNNKVFIFGGDLRGTTNTYNDGAVYDTQTDSWTSTTMVGAPSSRTHPTCHFVNGKIIVQGGIIGIQNDSTNDGYIYDLQNDIWTPITTTNAPLKSGAQTSVVMGNHLYIWGGAQLWFNTFTQNSAIYTP